MLVSRRFMTHNRAIQRFDAECQIEADFYVAVFHPCRYEYLMINARNIAVLTAGTSSSQQQSSSSAQQGGGGGGVSIKTV